MNSKRRSLIVVSCLVVAFAVLEAMVLFELVGDDMTLLGMCLGAIVWIVLTIGGLYLVVKEKQDRVILVGLTLLLSAFAGVSTAGIDVPMLAKWAQIINVVLGFMIVVLGLASFSVCWGECRKKKTLS